MRDVTQEQVINILRTIGIQAGDGLMIHSAIQFLGRPIGGIGMYLDAIQTVIGSDGNLAVPTFNFAFARGEPFDPQNTPSEGMGAFSEYVRQHPAAQRTLHPMQSLAVLGHYADDLAQRDTLSAFDSGSPFDRMLELDFKLILLGADIQYSAMIHYSEQRANVPYRYWKDFTGQVKTPMGWQERTYRMFVRDLDLDPYIELKPIQDMLESRHQWTVEKLNYGRIATCRLDEFVSATDELLADDPWILVTNPPADRLK
jgi:aminoglycoside N3'-acetyltransferase